MTSARLAFEVPPRPKGGVNGVVLLDKPVGITSQTAVSKLKRLFGAGKAGHTGTLDPMASGLLPVCLGEATKFSHVMLEADKGYRASIRLGISTSTGDIEGDVTRTALVNVERASLEKVLARFVGNIMQTPPMYSALKHQGRPLYKYARAGVHVARQPRPVRIERLKIESYLDNEVQIALTCSKGTYIRVLAEDIGRTLGCGACLSALRRTAVGGFGIDAAVTLDALAQSSFTEREARLLAVDALVTTLPRIELSGAQARRLLTGLAVQHAGMGAVGLVRLYGPGQEYLGIGMVEALDTIVPRRLMSARGLIEKGSETHDGA